MNILLVPILVPILAGVIVMILPRKLKAVAQVLTFIAATVALAASIKIFTSSELCYQVNILGIGRFSLSFDLLAGRLSSFILFFCSLFGVLVTLYSLKSVPWDEHLHSYLACLLFSIGGASGVLLSNHLLFLLIFWEIVTASLYFLVSLGRNDAPKAATKTFVMLGFSDCALLLGIGMLWLISGTFVISSIKVPVSSALPATAFLLIMIGAITKAGAMPLHTWIPAASKSASTSVMAFLPAAVDKLLGIYLLAKISIDLFILNRGLGMVLMVIGAVTVVAAVMMALVQHDLKQLLAYHAVSQVGYMVLGIGTGNLIGIAGGLFHMLNHAIYKSCLFLCSGAVEQQAKTTDLEKLGGLAKGMPVTFACCFIAAMAISGVPPLNGFVSKWMVYQGIINLGGPLSFVFLIAAMFGSALTLASFIKVIHSVFMGTRPRNIDRVGEVNWTMSVPLVVLALLCVVFGVFYKFPVEKLITPGLPGPVKYTGLWQAKLATGMLIIGIVIGILIYLAGSLRRLTRTSRPFTAGEILDTEMSRIPGTHFYETISSMKALKNIYRLQARGIFDLYAVGGQIGLFITRLLRAAHSGYLPSYLSWCICGILILLFVYCKVW